jgi:hypothetical protein
MNFKEWYDEDEHDTYNFPHESMEDAFNAGKSNGGWISIDDRLPGNKSLYLTFSTNSFGCHREVVMFETHGRPRWMSNRHSFADYERDVTHWMPLPEPPNE